MKITLIGGGGSRTPVLYHGLIGRQGPLGVHELVLHDRDEPALRRVSKVLMGIDESGGGVRHRTTTNLDDALEGAAFVLSAIRVGGFEARGLDESIPLEHGVVGQETVGPGGFALALRHVPALQSLASAMRTRCPQAWLINLTNPAGMVTQAVGPMLDGRVVGVCDSPLALGRRVAEVLGTDVRRLHLGYGGLNHLGWLSAVWDDGRDVLPALLESPEASRIEEVRLFGAGAIHASGGIPNEYVYFYKRADRAFGNIARGGSSRGQFLLAEQRALAADLEAAATPRDALEVYRRSLQVRTDTYMKVEAELARAGTDDVFASAGGYHEMALSVVEAIGRDRPAVLIVNTRNGGALDFLPPDDVVEVPAVVRRAGVFPLDATVPTADQSLVEQVKEYERATLAAIESRSVDAGVAALASNPLVPDARVAAAIMKDYLRKIPALATALGAA